MAKVHSLLKNPLGGHFRLRRGTKYDDFGPLEPDLGLLSAHYQLNADFFNRLGYSPKLEWTVCGMEASGVITWHDVFATGGSERRGSEKGDAQMLRAAPRVGSPTGARTISFGGVAPGFGWFGLGAL